jgi:O-succinylbenzoic acid--CoA ligase
MIKINGTYYASLEDIKSCSLSYELTQFLELWFNDDDFITIKTSGSTGKPKEIKLLKKHMINSAKATCSFFNLKENQTSLLCLPTKYIGGQMMVVRSIVNKLNLIVTEPSLQPLKNITSKIDFAAFTPQQVFHILKENKKSFSLIENIIIGGGKVNTNLLNELKDFKNNILSTYGMTETCSHIALKKINSTKKEYFNALPDVSFEIDENNCLVIDAPEISSEKIKTNDVINLVSNTSFEWLGRYDNIINSGGIKIYPEEIEEKLQSIISNTFYITSKKDDELGEKLILVIEGDLSEEEKQIIIKKSKEVLQKHHIPKEVICFKEFERTQTNKLMRRKF